VGPAGRLRSPPRRVPGDDETQLPRRDPNCGYRTTSYAADPKPCPHRRPGEGSWSALNLHSAGEQHRCSHPGEGDVANTGGGRLGDLREP
jgi:hypothetical protein